MTAKEAAKMSTEELRRRAIEEGDNSDAMELLWERRFERNRLCGNPFYPHPPHSYGMIPV